jgi:hypothetical protein
MSQTRTAEDIIKLALKSIGVLGSGQSPSAEDADDALSALQDLIASWSAENLMVYYIEEQENFTLVSGTPSYTIGSAGDFNTTRPTEIVGAFVRVSDRDYPVEIVDANTYRKRPLKSQANTPYYLYYNPDYPLGDVYVYPAGDGELYIDSIKPLEEPSAVSDDMTFPEGYNRALRFNLAVDLAPEYGRQVSPELRVLAKESKQTIKRRSAAFHVEAVPIAMIGVAGARFDIDNC